MKLRVGMVFIVARDGLLRTITQLNDLDNPYSDTVEYRRSDGRRFVRDRETIESWANDRNYWRLQHPECLRLPDGV